MEDVYRESMAPSFELRDTPLSVTEVVLVCGTVCVATAILLWSACLAFQSHCIRRVPARRTLPSDSHAHMHHLVLSLSIHDPPVAMPPFVVPPPPSLPLPPPPPPNENSEGTAGTAKQFTLVSHPNGHVALGTQ